MVVQPGLVKKLIEQQKQLMEKVTIRPFEGDLKIIAGTDSSIVNKTHILSVFVLFEYPSMKEIELVSHISELTLPYIPGLLAFREIPNILKAYEKLKDEPDLIVVDGHGICHPRRLGIASHLGVTIDKPTFGIAKKPLVGVYEMPAQTIGSYTKMTFRGEHVGYALRSKTNVKPVFVSPGHLVDFDDTLKLSLKLLGKYRLPEVTRIADSYSKSLKP